jgi:hypothetical protein
MKPIIWSATMKDSIAWLEHIVLRIGQAPLLGWCIQKDIKQHDDMIVDEGVSMELVSHITSDVKNKLHFLQDEDVGWILVAILNLVQQWRHNGMEFLLNNVSGTIHGRHCSYNNNIGARVNVGIWDPVGEGLQWNMNWFI